MSRASEIIGATPRPPVRAISLPVHRCLSQWVGRSEPPPLVLVACSGGADSMALALAAIDSAHRLGCEVHTVTVDHGLREESADEAASVAAYLETMGAHSHVLGRSDVDFTQDAAVGRGSAIHVAAHFAEEHAGPEGTARALRYRAILECVARIRQGRHPHTQVLVLLGHTMDDQAETVLLRLARGSGVGSLKAMAEVSVLDAATANNQMGVGANIVLRPLLSLRREDTLAFCDTLACPVIDDPTNALDGPWRSADGSPLRRSAIRHSALPSIREALGVDPVPALARTAALARDDDEALAEYASQAFTTAFVDLSACEDIPSVGCDHAAAAGGGAPATLILAIAPLVELPRAVRRRVLQRACLQAGAPAGKLSAQHLTAVDELITHWSGQGPLHLPRLAVWRYKGADGMAFLSFAHLPS